MTGNYFKNSRNPQVFKLIPKSGVPHDWANLPPLLVARMTDLPGECPCVL
jgi:hypothetical protein